jgi:N-acetyl-anhydromuramyl-L-alanine amidase AmpD
MEKLSRVLKLKMSGDDIKWIQLRLKENGFYNHLVNGHFDQNTLISVTNFQRRFKLKTNGLVGIQTFLFLKNLNKEIEIKVDDFKYGLSYVGDNGLKIYDNLISTNSYNKVETKKDTIWLHNSNGNSRPDWKIGSWGLKNSKHYVIGRSSSSSDYNLWDGKIIKAIDDKYWSNHLNVDCANSNDLNSKSISIEICNYGGLVFRDGIFFNLVNKPINPIDIIELEDEFMGYKFYEKYTDSQLESIRKLILFLEKKMEMEITRGIYNKQWFNYHDKWFTLGGIRTQGQVNRDVISIFPQKEMIEMLNSL